MNEIRMTVCKVHIIMKCLSKRHFICTLFTYVYCYSIELILINNNNKKE